MKCIQNIYNTRAIYKLWLQFSAMLCKEGGVLAFYYSILQDNFLNDGI